MLVYTDLVQRKMAAPIHEALTQLQSLRRSLPHPNNQDQSIREELLIEARKLLLSLERPHNVVERICFQVSPSEVQTHDDDPSADYPAAMGDHRLPDCNRPWPLRYPGEERLHKLG